MTETQPEQPDIGPEGPIDDPDEDNPAADNPVADPDVDGGPVEESPPQG